jgi:hypothetical protein
MDKTDIVCPLCKCSFGDTNDFHHHECSTLRSDTGANKSRNALSYVYSAIIIVVAAVVSYFVLVEGYSIGHWRKYTGIKVSLMSSVAQCSLFIVFIVCLYRYSPFDRILYRILFAIGVFLAWGAAWPTF